MNRPDDENNLAATSESQRRTETFPRKKFHPFLALLGVSFMLLPTEIWTGISADLKFAMICEHLTSLNENELSLYILVGGVGLIMSMIVGMLGRRAVSLVLLGGTILIGLLLAFMLVSAI